LGAFRSLCSQNKTEGISLCWEREETVGRKSWYCEIWRGEGGGRGDCTLPGKARALKKEGGKQEGRGKKGKGSRERGRSESPAERTWKASRERKRREKGSHPVQSSEISDRGTHREEREGGRLGVKNWEFKRTPADPKGVLWGRGRRKKI